MTRRAWIAALGLPVWRTYLLAALTGMVLIGAVHAADSQIGPRAALEFHSGSPETTRAVAQALREGDPWEQLDWTFTLRPSVLYRQYLDDRGGTTFNPRISSTLQVRFGETPLESVRRATRLERALRNHDRAVRLETRNGLLAFAELLIAQDAYSNAAIALRQVSPDATTADVQASELNVRGTEADLQAAQREAAVYGLRGDAYFEALRFQAPQPPRVTELSVYRLQELALAEAETRYIAAGGAGILKDFRLGLGYRNDQMEIDLETGLLAGRPGVRLGTIHPGGRSRMDVRISAELAVGDAIHDRPQLREEVELAADELARLAEELWASWLSASFEADLTEAALDVELEFLYEATLASNEALMALTTLPTDADDREKVRQEGVVERANRDVQRLSTRVFRAWITYVRRHHDMLESAEAGWAIRIEGNTSTLIDDFRVEPEAP